MSTTEIYQFHIGDANVGIITNSFEDPEIIQQVIYNSKLRIYASPTYLEQNPLPKTIEDLSSHKLIIYNDGDQALEEINIHINKLNTHIRSFINVNNGLSLRKGLIIGLGVGPYEYDRELMKNNLLIDLFPDMPGHNIPYYFTYHRRLEGSPKIQAFHNFMNDVVKVWERPEKR